MTVLVNHLYQMESYDHWSGHLKASDQEVLRLTHSIEQKPLHLLSSYLSCIHSLAKFLLVHLASALMNCLLRLQQKIVSGVVYLPSRSSPALLQGAARFCKTGWHSSA